MSFSFTAFFYAHFLLIPLIIGLQTPYFYKTFPIFFVLEIFESEISATRICLCIFRHIYLSKICKSLKFWALADFCYSRSPKNYELLIPQKFSAKIFRPFFLPLISLLMLSLKNPSLPFSFIPFSPNPNIIIYNQISWADSILET